MSNAHWERLAALQQQQSGVSLLDRFRQDKQRATRYSMAAGPLFVDFSKQAIDDDIIATLVELATSSELKPRLQAIMTGAQVNNTEQRAACHNRLRQFDNSDDPAVHDMFNRMQALVASIHDGNWRGATDKAFRQVVNIGIGGSDFGPRLVCDCLSHSVPAQMEQHFISNIDPQMLEHTLPGLDPETTLFIVSSKSFGTDETLSNAQAARQWLQERLPGQDIGRHFIAVTANIGKAEAFGISQQQQLNIPEWVGGRFSVWSAIGLPVALGFGMAQFKALLAGGRAIDEHVAEQPAERNLPAILGLIDIWNVNLQGARSLAILPYDHSLRALPDYLQQLFMESLGKSVAEDGTALGQHSCPVIWGSEGTNGQHSFHQLLHQGSEYIPCDFILPLSSSSAHPEQHEKLVANCLAQSLALMQGQLEDDIYQALCEQGEVEARARLLARHKAMPGNRPSTTICLQQSDAESLGALIALYEYRAITAGCIWDINPFDQWGVELGKTLSQQLLPAIQGESTSAQNYDGSTRQLLERFHQAKTKS